VTQAYSSLAYEAAIATQADSRMATAAAAYCRVLGTHTLHAASAADSLELRLLTVIDITAPPSNHYLFPSDSTPTPCRPDRVYAGFIDSLFSTRSALSASPDQCHVQPGPDRLTEYIAALPAW